VISEGLPHGGHGDATGFDAMHSDGRFLGDSLESAMPPMPTAAPQRAFVISEITFSSPLTARPVAAGSRRLPHVGLDISNLKNYCDDHKFNLGDAT